MIHVWTLLVGLSAALHQAHKPSDDAVPATHQLSEHSNASGALQDPHDIGVSRCLTAGESPSERVSPQRMIAPGLPPLLSFRYYEGRAHYRFGNNDLMLDDAGH